MSARRVRIELLNRRIVRDRNGRIVGRIHDMKAEQRNGELVIVEYHLGRAALLHRFGVSLLSAVGIRLQGDMIRIPWEQLDLSDPDAPTFLGDAEELREQRERKHHA